MGVGNTVVAFKTNQQSLFSNEWQVHSLPDQTEEERKASLGGGGGGRGVWVWGWKLGAPCQFSKKIIKLFFQIECPSIVSSRPNRRGDKGLLIEGCNKGGLS